MQHSILKHPVFTHAQDIFDLCKPLHILDITYFCHVRIDKENNFSGIANNTEFSEYYLNNKCYNADIHLAKHNQFNKYILWDILKKKGKTKEMDKTAWNLGVKHAFTIVKEEAHSKNFYHFATKFDIESINQVYLNNFDILEKFITYFNQQMGKSKALSHAYNIKYSIDKKHAEFTIEDIDSVIHINDQRSSFIENLSLYNPFDLSEKDKSSIIILHKDTNKMIKLAPQQAKCLALTLQGFSFKEIGKKLCISYRSVEHYVDRLKHVLGCRNVKEIILSYSIQDIQFLR